MSEILYLVRHAAPDWSRTDLVYHQPPGPPLTAEGRQQAVALGAFLRQANTRQLFASPLERCAETGRIAAQIAGAPFAIDDGLIEWQPGDTTASVQERIRPIFLQAAALSAAGPVALVTHGGPIGALLLELGMDEKALASRRTFDHHNPLPTGGAWQASRAHPQAAWELSLVFKPEISNPVI